MDPSLTGQLPTQAQLNAYFAGGNNPWVGMGPPASAAPGIPPALSANNATPDQLDRLANVLKAKQSQPGLPAAPGASASPWSMIPQETPPAAPGTSPPAGQNVTRGTPAARQDVQDIMGQLDKTSLEALKQQGLSVDQLKDRLEKLQAKDLPPDYRPLAAIGDILAGGNVADKLTPSETPQQRAAMLTQLQEAILKGQQGMSQDELSMLKTKLQTVWHEDEVSAREQQHQETLAAQNAYREALLTNNKNKFDTGEFDKATKSFNSDPVVVDAMKKRDEISQFQAQVIEAQKNPVANNTLPMALVKLYVNRVSQAELGGAKGAQDLEDRAKQTMTQMSSGTLTPENAKWMTDLANDLAKRNAANLQGHIERHAATYSRSSGMPKDEATDAISGGLYRQVKGMAGPSDDEKAQAKAWLADPKNAKDPNFAKVQALVQ